MNQTIVVILEVCCYVQPERVKKRKISFLFVVLLLFRDAQTFSLIIFNSASSQLSNNIRQKFTKALAFLGTL